MADEGSKSRLEIISQTVQVLSVVAGVIISVFTYTQSVQKDSEARQQEAAARLTAQQHYYDQKNAEQQKLAWSRAQPYRELRQKRYAEALQVSAVLCAPEDHTAAEIKQAKQRFRALYIVELSLVEQEGVESAMVKMADAVDPALLKMNKRQLAAFHLSHALRNSLRSTWQITGSEKDG